jgi:hypothetical protein
LPGLPASSGLSRGAFAAAALGGSTLNRFLRSLRVPVVADQNSTGGEETEIGRSRPPPGRSEARAGSPAASVLRQPQGPLRPPLSGDAAPCQNGKKEVDKTAFASILPISATVGIRAQEAPQGTTSPAPAMSPRRWTGELWHAPEGGCLGELKGEPQQVDRREVMDREAPQPTRAGKDPLLDP